MAEFRTESLNWLDKLETLRAQPPDATPAELMKALDQRKSQVSDFQTIDKCFDLAAVEKVRKAAKAGSLPNAHNALGQSNPVAQLGASQQMPYTLSFRNARTLAGLKKAMAGDLTAFHAALDLTLKHQLTNKQIEALVDWLVQGNSLESFIAPEAGKKGTTKTDKRTDKGKNRLTTTDAPTEDLTAQLMELAEKANAEKARGDGQTAARDKLKALLEKIVEDAKKQGDSGKKDKEEKKSKPSSNNQSDWFWEMLLGVKFVSQLRSRAKKGELTTTDKVLILLYFIFGKPFEFIFKHLGKLLKGTAKDFGNWLKHTLGKTFSQIIQWAVPLIIICALIWGLGKVYQWVVVNPLHWIESEVKSEFHHEDITPAQTPIPAPVSVPPPMASQTSISKGLGQPKRVSRPVVETQVYQPSVSFAPPASPSDSSGVLTTLYDPKLLEQEIAALPKNCIVKAFPLSPDESMPGDMAVSRLQDLIDPDKYTMFIGSGKEKITFITPNNTNLIITYKSTDPFDIWGGSGPLNFFWEDVLYIHTDEIDVVDKTSIDKRYQISLVSSSSKYALTIQCATAADMSHLVGTLEYFIRHSRLGRDTSLAGLPYPSQGLVLNNDCVVDKLWADSPMVKAGVTLGEHLWSIGTIASKQQSRNDLEIGLRSVPVTFFAASPAEWEKALTAFRNPSLANNFRPKLRKVILTTP